jgi:RNA polymerase sigma-70 factor (ECF subfamily)
MSNTIDTDAWVDRYADLLYRYALVRVSDRQVAEDLVQETFVSALNAAERFAGDSSEKTWLVGILKHKILDHYRRSHRGINKALDSTPDMDQFFDSTGHWREMPQHWGKNPETLLRNKEFVAVLYNCVDALPERQKRVFVMRELDGIEGEEISKVLGVTATNLWVMLHRARHRLRDCLQAKWFKEK